MKSINRNVLRTLPLLVLIPLVSQAQAQTQTQVQAQAPASTAIAIDCDHRYISQVDASRVLGTANFSQTYAKRQALYADVARTCHRGVQRVLLLTDVPAERHGALATR